MDATTPGHPASAGAHLIVGPAGSGKTTWLRRRYTELVAAGEQGVLLLVGGRRARRALADAILRDVGHSTEGVRVATWHSFALGLIRVHFRRLGYRQPPGLLTGPEQFTLVKGMLASEAEREHWAQHPQQLRLTTFVEELRELVLRAQDALLSPEELAEMARAAGRLELVEAASFFRRYLDRIDAREDAVIDHANVIARAHQLLTDERFADPAVTAEIRAQTRHILVDDYHDVTPAQEKLLRELFVTGGSIAVTANPDARVFGFRGAAEAAIERFATDFKGAERIELTEVRRVPAERAAWRFAHLSEEADAVAREARRMHARDGVPWGEIAIIVRRFGAGSRAIRRALERAGVPFVVVAENRALASEPALIPMLELARVALGNDVEERLPKLLASPVVGFDPYEVRALRREARLRETTLADLVADPPPDLPDSLAGPLRTLLALLDEIRARDPNDRPDEVFAFLWERLDYFRAMVAGGDEDALDAVRAFADAIARFSERRVGKRFSDYLTALAGVDFGPEPWNMPEERRPNAVRIMTAHSSIGAEFDSVIVAGCVEGDFPDARERRAMLDLRDLLDPATPFDRLAARMAEERRLFGVAISRARRRLILTAAHESSQREVLSPSPFVALAGLGWSERPAGDEPLTRDEAEATWRRALRDASVAPDERRRALDGLARLPGVDPDTWWYEREWTDPQIPLVEGELRTSYSRLSSYDNCALQYLYQVELGLDPDESHAMRVGSWVHDIVDLCSRGEIEKTEQALIAALDAVWDPSIFESVAIAHRRRLDCEEMLRVWLRNDGDLDTLASEVEFTFPIDGALMRGRIDRVVRLGNSMVRLIDYKTSRNAKSQPEVDDDLQLASYYLALKRDPDLAKLGQPKYLELAYLGAFYKGGFVRRGVDPTKDPAYERNAQERLESFVAGIRDERFAPSPSADCHWCRFKSLCPVWPEGDELIL